MLRNGRGGDESPLMMQYHKETAARRKRGLVYLYSFALVTRVLAVHVAVHKRSAKER
jgi:hypothetical protein